MKLHELLEKRAAAVSAMRKLADMAEGESRDLTADEVKTFDKLKAEVADLDGKIERARTLDDIERRAPAVVSRVGDGSFEQRAREFRITAAIAAQLEPGSVDAGAEREISQEVARRVGRKPQGFFIPDEVFQVERRTLLAASSAADLIPNVHRADLFIDRLRAALVVGRLGATVLDGLVGNIDIPRQTGSSAAQWVGEDGSLTETDAAFDDVNLTPRTVGALTSFSRRTIINAVPSIEELVRRDLAAVIANAIDEKALLGDGTANTPKGIAAQTGVNTPPLSSPPTWAEVLGVIASIQSDNADIGAMGWAMHPLHVAGFRATPRHATAALDFLMESANALAGYGVATTTALPITAGPPAAAPLFFGAWSQLLVAYWSGTDILVNPYAETAYAKGRVQVRAMRDCDVGVRHAESFAYVAAAPTASAATQPVE